MLLFTGVQYTLWGQPQRQQAGAYSGRNPDYELWKVQVEGVKGVLRQDIYALVYPKPPSRFLGLIPLKRYFWNWRKGLPRWFCKRFCEAPRFLTPEDLQGILSDVQQYLLQEGYLSSRVTLHLDTLSHRKRRLRLRIVAESGEPFRIGKFVPIDSPISLRFFIPYLMDHPARPRKRFSYDLLDADRETWTTIFQNEGYVFFSPSFILYELDSFHRQHIVDVYMRVRAPRQWLHPYRLRAIRIIDGDPLCTEARFSDSLVLTRGRVPVIIYTDDPKRLRWKVLLQKIPFQDSSLQDYARKQQLMTNGMVSLALYRYMRPVLRPVDSQWTDLWLCLDRAPAQSLTLDLSGGTGTATLAGVRLSVSYTHRNLFRGSEQLEISGNLGTELQVLAQQQIFQLWRGELQASVRFPQLAFIPERWKRRWLTASTQTAISTLFERRPEFSYLQLSGNLGYTWKAREDYMFQNKALIQHEVQPFSVFLIRTFNLAPEYQELIARTPRLRQSFEDQYIFAGRYTLLIDQVYRKRSRYWYLLSQIEWAGNLLTLLQDLTNLQVFPYAHAQFLRTEVDLRRYIRFYFPPKTVLIFRGVGGIIVPYGVSEVAPYLRQFYVGGSSSLRAWTIRSSGPGSTPYDTLGTVSALLFNNRTGDIRLEFNVEYRIGVGNFVEGALFADIGNVWLLRGDRQEAIWSWNRFWQELAVAGGIGLRINLVYFIFRCDFALKLYDPALPLEERFVLPHLRDRQWQARFYNQYGYKYPFWNLVLALGYPF